MLILQNKYAFAELSYTAHFSQEACAQTNLSDGDQSPPGPAIQSEPTAPSPPPTNPAAVRATNPLLGCSPSHKPSAADSVAKDLVSTIEKCQCLHPNNTTLIKQISLFDTVLVMKNN